MRDANLCVKKLQRKLRCKANGKLLRSKEAEKKLKCRARRFNFLVRGVG